MTRVWIRHRQPYSWRLGDGPWNPDEVVLYRRGLIGFADMEAAARARHPGADFMFHTAWNEEQKSGFTPPPDQIHEDYPDPYSADRQRAPKKRAKK